MPLTIRKAAADEVMSSSSGGRLFKTEATVGAVVAREGQVMLKEASERTTALSAENSGASCRSLSEDDGSSSGYRTYGHYSHHTNRTALHLEAGRVSSAAPIAAEGVASAGPLEDIITRSELVSSSIEQNQLAGSNPALEIYAQLSNLEDDLDASLSPTTIMETYGMEFLGESTANDLLPLAPRIDPQEDEEEVAIAEEGGEEVAGGEVGRQRCRGPGPAGIKLRRQGALSDLWQHQGAFRSNRRRMKSVFQEFAATLDLPQNLGRRKAEIKDIFTFTSVGYKHLVTSSPSEDRIAIHQAVVPTINGEAKEELNIENIDNTPFAMFGVFDGHGGPACAEFLKNSVSTVLAHSPFLYDEDLAPFQRRACATADSFTQLEQFHNEWARTSGDLSGSTAILSTFQDGILVMAGVGDSAGLYVDHQGNSHMLCPQHSTSNAREVERVLNMGGTIVNNRVAGCLMPTRTIGDLDCKQALGEIVSPHPEIKLAAIYAPPEEGIDQAEPFLVLASDGLWDVMSNHEVATLTQRGLRMLRVKTAKVAAKKAKEEAKAKTKKSSTPSTPRSSAHKRGWFSKKQSHSSDSDGEEKKAGEEVGSHRSSLKDRFFHNMERDGSSDGAEGSFLDLSRSTKGLDASVRGGHGGGGHVASAALDESLYGGRRASIETGMLELEEGDDDIIERAHGVQPVAMTTTAATAGIRTSGSPDDNPAMHLVRAAIRAHSKDDISVVVVSFRGGADDGRPGSLARERRGSRGPPKKQE